MADEENTGGQAARPPTGAQQPLHENTQVQVKLGHVLAGVLALITGAFLLAQYFYEETKSEIQEIRKKVEDLEDDLEEVDDKVDNNSHKIGEVLRQLEAAERIANAFGVSQDDAEDLVGLKPVDTIHSRRVKGRSKGISRPFVSAGAGDPGTGDSDPDLDGVPLPYDLCPTERETWNGYQDQDGCPDEGTQGELQSYEPWDEALEDPWQEQWRLARHLCATDERYIQFVGERACEVCLTQDLVACEEATLQAVGEGPSTLGDHYQFDLGLAVQRPESGGRAMRAYERLYRKNLRRKHRADRKRKRECARKWDDKKCWTKPLSKHLGRASTRLHYAQLVELSDYHPKKKITEHQKALLASQGPAHTQNRMRNKYY